jgi:RNA polymerase sigma-70 factor (ECF subfamily)
MSEGTRLSDDQAERWRRVLKLHGAALLLFARQWTATRGDAEDAVQDGFVKFWKTRANARDELAYLYACVRGAAMDQSRGRRRRAAHEHAASQHADEPAFEIALENAERNALVEAAIKQLPGDQREVVVMKIWGGLTFAQVGEALGIPLNTAASRYRYALARLEAELSEEVSRE